MSERTNERIDERDGSTGGDPACWAHLFEAEAVPLVQSAPLVVDLGAVPTRGASGAVWHLPHGGDLDANLVRLNAGDAIDEHINDALDVLVFVQSGGGTLTVDDIEHALRADVVALVPRGARRSYRAGGNGLTYLSIHRRRDPMGVGRTPRSRPGP